MDTGIKITQRDYTMAFKLAVVEQVEKGDLTCGQAQLRYGIQGNSTVLMWLRKHGRQSWGRAASLAAMPIDKTTAPATPEQRIKELETQLGLAKEKARLFEAVLKVLKKDHGVRVIPTCSSKGLSRFRSRAASSCGWPTSRTCRPLTSSCISA